MAQWKISQALLKKCWKSNHSKKTDFLCVEAIQCD